MHTCFPHKKHFISAQLWHIYFSFSPTLRRSQSSLYVWRLHQTSSASSSSPSNGCFLLPALTYGSSMSGTQVSPSFLWILFISIYYNKWLLSPQKLLIYVFFPVLLSRRERSLSTYCIAVDPVCVHRSCHPLQRSEELSC